MSHHHGSGSCNSDCQHHDHDSGTGPADNLYSFIDLPNTIALNVADETSGTKVIKPWHERQDETVWIESDSDDQMIIKLPFTGSVKLRSLLIKAGPGEYTPSKVYLFANGYSLDFSDVAEKEPTQSFNIPQSRDIGEYSVKVTKFSNISSLSLFFPSAQGAETVKVYYIGLRGTWSEWKQDPVITVYESQANLADHDRIQGTDGAMDTLHLG